MVHGRKQCHFLLFAALLAAILLASPVRAQTVELTVPRITVYPGDMIRADTLTSRKFRARVAQLPVIHSADRAVGKVARRTLIAGKPIPVTYLREPEVVRQGKAVRIIYSHGALEISGIAVALQSGGVGDVISLRNVDSGATIRGVAEADGTVRIFGP